MTGKSVDIKAKLELDIVIVRYGELALKSSGVRNWYEKILMKNIAAMLESREIPYSQIRESGAGYSLRPQALVLPPKLRLMFLE